MIAAKPCRADHAKLGLLAYRDGTYEARGMDRV